MGVSSFVEFAEGDGLLNALLGDRPIKDTNRGVAAMMLAEVGDRLIQLRNDFGPVLIGQTGVTEGKQNRTLI